MASRVLRTVVLLCILALAIAHRVPGDDYDPSISSDANGADGMVKSDDVLSSLSSTKFENGVVPNGRTAKCAKKCSFKCLPKLLEGPVSYALCFGKCTLKCKFFGPFSAAGDCTLDCARSITTSHLQSQYASIADTTRYVEGFVDSCYQSCSKYQNNLKN